MIKAERSCSTGQHLLTHMKRSNNMICCQVVGDTPRSIGLIDALEQERHWHSHIFVARSNFLSQSSFHHSVVHLTIFFLFLIMMQEILEGSQRTAETQILSRCVKWRQLNLVPPNLTFQYSSILGGSTRVDIIIYPRGSDKLSKNMWI